MYEILFSSAAERLFKKLKEKALRNISVNPYIGQPKRGDLTGIYGFDVKYKNINYEIAYTISEVNGKKMLSF